MVKAWKKYIERLSNKEKLIFRDVIQSILLKNFDWLDTVKMTWKLEKYRCRIWNRRIIFTIDNWKVTILKIWPRGDIYK